MNRFVKLAAAATIAGACALAMASPSEAQYYGRGGALGYGALGFGGGGFANEVASYGYVGYGTYGAYGAYASAGPYGYRNNDFLCRLSPALIIYVPCETWGGGG